MQRELDSLPGLIEELEQKQQALEATIASADFYQGERAHVEVVLAELASVQTQLENTFERWAELEAGAS